MFAQRGKAFERKFLTKTAFTYRNHGPIDYRKKTLSTNRSIEIKNPLKVRIRISLFTFVFSLSSCCKDQIAAFLLSIQDFNLSRSTKLAHFISL